MADAKNTKQAEKERQKSIVLLVIFFFFLFNAAMMFRAGINTLYFTEDTSSDYAPVQARVEQLLPDMTVKQGEQPRITPVFSFTYKGKNITMEAPGLSFAPVQGRLRFKQDGEYTLWVHKNRGELILPPQAGQKEIGRSQLLISGVFLLLAVAVWILRSRIAAKARR